MFISDNARIFIFRDVPFSMVLFQSFAMISEGRTSFTEILFSGLLAGSIGAVFATPMDVMKTRYQAEWYSSLQTFQRPRSLLEIYHDTFKNEGLFAFYRGSLQRCMIIGPLFGISLATYHLQQKLLSTLKNDK